MNTFKFILLTFAILFFVISSLAVMAGGLYVAGGFFMLSWLMWRLVILIGIHQQNVENESKTVT